MFGRANTQKEDLLKFKSCFVVLSNSGDDLFGLWLPRLKSQGNNTDLSQRVMRGLKTSHPHSFWFTVGVQEIVATIILNGTVIGLNHVKVDFIEQKAVEYHLISCGSPYC